MWYSTDVIQYWQLHSPFRGAIPKGKGGEREKIQPNDYINETNHSTSPLLWNPYVFFLAFLKPHFQSAKKFLSIFLFWFFFLKVPLYAGLPQGSPLGNSFIQIRSLNNIFSDIFPGYILIPTFFWICFSFHT